MLSVEEINKLLPGGHTVVEDGYFYIYFRLETPMTKANGTIDRYTYRDIMKHINKLSNNEKEIHDRRKEEDKRQTLVAEINQNLEKRHKYERQYKFKKAKPKMVCKDCHKQCTRRGASQKRCVICQNRVDRERTKRNNNLKKKVL